MRPTPFALLSLVTLAACAGHVVDYMRPRPSIITPQLLRYGLDLNNSRCVAQRLGAALNPRQLRDFATSAGAVRQSYFGAPNLTPRDLSYVASRLPAAHRDSATVPALAAALASCNVPLVAAAAPEIASAAAPAATVTPTPAPVTPTPEPVAPVQGPAPAVTVPASSHQTVAWLNLGAAGSGQSIAIDPSTIEQEGSTRTAWFRMTDPGAHQPGHTTYRLRIDCARRVVAPVARRQQEGAAGQERVYSTEQEPPMAVESGTVTEIAYLSLCT